jgi:hypothetical protein
MSFFMLGRDMFIIFLDIDGVLYRGSVPTHQQEEYNLLLQSYLAEKPVYARYVYEGILTDFARFRAQTYFFNPLALQNLESLIKHVEEKKIRVGIVLSSAWREFFDIPTLKILFSHLSFSNYLIDKTYDKACLKIEDSRAHEFNRAELIELWLGEHPSTREFIILDDNDCNFSDLFPEHFIHCMHLFGEEELLKSKNLADKILINAPMYSDVQNFIAPKVRKNYGSKDIYDNKDFRSRDCNEQLNALPMRVLKHTRQDLMKYLLKTTEGLFSSKNRKPEDSSTESLESITKLILEYEDESPKSWVSPYH